VRVCYPNGGRGPASDERRRAVSDDGAARSDLKCRVGAVSHGIICNVGVWGRFAWDLIVKGPGRKP